MRLIKTFYKKEIIVFILSLSPIFLVGQYSIEGQFVDTKKKHTRIILEYIPSAFNHYSFDMSNILNSAEIDTKGHFKLAGSDLPEGKNLYRLSVQKDADFVGISNGKWKNFIHIVLEPNTKLKIVGCADLSTTFGFCQILGSEESELLQQFYDQIIFSFSEDFESLRENNSSTKKQFIANKHTTMLKNYADTSSYLFPSILAFSHLDKIEQQIEDDPSFFIAFCQGLENKYPRSNYVIDIKNTVNSRLEFLNGPQTNYSKYIIGFLLCSLILLSGYIFKLRKKTPTTIMPPTSSADIERKFNSLSKKESEVYQYILTGKSNKEIASTLFIELNTVKSHISKIYQKLEVKSRKEAVALNDFRDKK